VNSKALNRKGRKEGAKIAERSLSLRTSRVSSRPLRLKALDVVILNDLEGFE